MAALLRADHRLVSNTLAVVGGMYCFGTRRYVLWERRTGGRLLAATGRQGQGRWFGRGARELVSVPASAVTRATDAA
jgi:hypothetical protein